jgi:hypothetical protein
MISAALISTVLRTIEIFVSARAFSNFLGLLMVDVGLMRATLAFVLRCAVVDEAASCRRSR